MFSDNCSASVDLPAPVKGAHVKETTSYRGLHFCLNCSLYFNLYLSVNSTVLFCINSLSSLSVNTVHDVIL